MSSQPRCVALRLVVSCPCLKLRSHNSGARVPACRVKCPNTENKSSRADTWAQVLRRECQHLVVNASDKSGMRAPRHCEAFLHCAFWAFCLALPHHHSIVMTRALVVRIATHDSDLIVRGALIIGTNKQPKCIVRRMGLCHAMARAPSRCSGHAHFPKPAALICTGMLSYFANCPGTVCPRDRSRYKTDAMKNEDGSVARDVSVNGVPVF